MQYSEPTEKTVGLGDRSRLRDAAPPLTRAVTDPDSLSGPGTFVSHSGVHERCQCPISRRRLAGTSVKGRDPPIAVLKPTLNLSEYSAGSGVPRFRAISALDSGGIGRDGARAELGQTSVLGCPSAPVPCTATGTPSFPLRFV